jgi:branched-subunit amino acid permease
MNTPRRFEKLASGIALAILAGGFVCLGVLSLVVSHLEGAADRTLSETTYSTVGSTTSILLGAIFFVAALVFTRTRPRDFV